ncbi:threonine synthase [Candidatus Sumerlaeota bacterium]|nr:threonine synthase [Candidatus Sumerlaeota bacterium]
MRPLQQGCPPVPASQTSEKLSFTSTNESAPAVDLREALLTGQAPDGGLYMPSRFPRLSKDELESFRGKPYHEIAADVIGRFATGIIDPALLAELCGDAYNFPVPLEQVFDRVYVMRLDRGPTASFKDFAARMMARLISQFLREDRRELTILTATSGDTGSAVASAFHGLPGIRVVVLFPIGEVSTRQRKQMTTLGGNITAIAVDGKFDDCQAMVKRAFGDADLRRIPLSSANSINIGRLIPQSVYYFHAWSRLTNGDEPIVICTPSGNFGNMMGAVFAREMGMPVKRIVVPVNENDEIPRFLATETYATVEPSVACLSNAMNVGNPSNLARLAAIYGGKIDAKGVTHRAPDLKALRRDIFSTSISDGRTRSTIVSAWKKHKLLLEPHGAVGWAGFEDYIAQEPLNGLPAVVVETAHPAKFPDEIERNLGFTPEVPDSLSALESLPEKCERMRADYDAFKEYLKNNF